jgi:hypothetical protein
MKKPVPYEAEIRNVNQAVTQAWAAWAKSPTHENLAQARAATERFFFLAETVTRLSEAMTTPIPLPPLPPDPESN